MASTTTSGVKEAEVSTDARLVERTPGGPDGAVLATASAKRSVMTGNRAVVALNGKPLVGVQKKRICRSRGVSDIEGLVRYGLFV